jgi:hypothetical protein
LHYLCLIYHDPERMADVSSPELDSLVAELHATGRLVDLWQPEQTDSFARLRVRSGELRVENVSSDLFACAVLEARDLNDAIRVASRFPQAQERRIDIRSVTPAIKNAQ